MVHRLWNLIKNRSGSNSGVPLTWLTSWNPIGERTKLIAPPGGRSLSQVNSPFSTLTSQISGIKKPEVMASINGGQRLTVSPIWELTALNACGGIALNQSGSPCAAGTGGGSNPSNSPGHRNVSTIGFSCWEVTSCSRAADRPNDRTIGRGRAERQSDRATGLSGGLFRLLRRGRSIRRPRHAPRIIFFLGIGYSFQCGLVGFLIDLL